MGRTALPDRFPGQIDASELAIGPDAEQVGPAPVQPGPELLVSYSSPGAPKRADPPTPKRDGSWFEPAKITAVKQSRGLVR